MSGSTTPHLAKPGSLLSFLCTVGAIQGALSLQRQCLPQANRSPEARGTQPVLLHRSQSRRPGSEKLPRQQEPCARDQETVSLPPAVLWAHLQQQLDHLTTAPFVPGCSNFHLYYKFGSHCCMEGTVRKTLQDYFQKKSRFCGLDLEHSLNSP